MEWTPGGSNPDVEDRRNEGGGGGGFGGFGGGGGGFGGIHLGIGGTLILLVLSFLFKTNLFQFFGGSGGPVSEPSRVEQPVANNRATQNDPKVQFVGAVLRDVQETWDRRLPESGKNYRHAKLDLFRDSISSACGEARSATGPFYCPGDEKVYVDLGFFDELKTRFGAPGEFAQAYVLAHEVGHHVQKILGIEAQVERAEQRNPSMRNQYSVRVELQADCFAGVWASHPSEVKLDQSDIEAGLRAAAAVGDDRLQKMSRGTVSPETFTHGSSAQRMQWFRTGYQNGTVASCDTFSQR